MTPGWWWVFAFGVVFAYLMVGGVIARLEVLSSIRTCENCHDEDHLCVTHGGGNLAAIIFLWGLMALIVGPWLICRGIAAPIDYLRTAELRKQKRDEENKTNYQRAVETLKEAGVAISPDILAQIEAKA